MVLQSPATSPLLVDVPRLGQGGVNNDVNLAALDVVNDIRAAFVDLENSFDFEADFAQTFSRADGGDDVEAQTSEPAREDDRLSLIAFVDADKGRAARWQFQPSAHHRLRVSLAEGLTDAHHFARRVHLW